MTQNNGGQFSRVAQEVFSKGVILWLLLERGETASLLKPDVFPFQNMYIYLFHFTILNIDTRNIYFVIG